MNMLTIKIKNEMRKTGRKRGSLVKDPKPVRLGAQGNENRISIDATMAIAPAALLGKALSIA